jgi:hypothetical protein
VFSPGNIFIVSTPQKWVMQITRQAFRQLATREGEQWQAVADKAGERRRITATR